MLLTIQNYLSFVFVFITNKNWEIESSGILEDQSDEAQILFDTAKELDPTYSGDFILSPPKVAKASVSVSILASADWSSKYLEFQFLNIHLLWR